MTKSGYLRGIKIYDEMRTAHLERRSAASGGMRLFYRQRYYDFDESKAASAGVVQSGYPGILRALYDKDLECAELLEPLFIRQMVSLLLYLAAIKIGNFVHRRKTLVVAYAIENLPLRKKTRSLLPRLHRYAYPLLRAVVTFIMFRFDRIAFGTEQSQQVYTDVAPALRRHVDVALVPALEPACQLCTIAKTPATLMFLGAFEDRKGIRELMWAWPHILEHRPDLKLTILGKGPLVEEVSRWAEGRSEVRLIVDPPRDQIHHELSHAATVILYSVSSDSWKEQVGLPIVEGLSHGCRIISSSDTGLAQWLHDHGHFIAHNLSDQAGDLATFIAAPPDPASVLNALPADSGRANAEEWLWRAR